MARHAKEIDKKQFESLCALQCTEAEICGWFDVTEKTLNSWCKRTYHMNFSQIFQIKRSKGKVSLRRYQFQQAEKSATMAIWLGKNWLGQTDKVDVQATVTQGKDPLTIAFEELENDDGKD